MTWQNITMYMYIVCKNISQNTSVSPFFSSGVAVVRYEKRLRCLVLFSSHGSPALATVELGFIPYIVLYHPDRPLSLLLGKKGLSFNGTDVESLVSLSSFSKTLLYKDRTNDAVWHCSPSTNTVQVGQSCDYYNYYISSQSCPLAKPMLRAQVAVHKKFGKDRRRKVSWLCSGAVLPRQAWGYLQLKIPGYYQTWIWSCFNGMAMSRSPVSLQVSLKKEEIFFLCMIVYLSFILQCCL